MVGSILLSPKILVISIIFVLVIKKKRYHVWYFCFIFYWHLTYVFKFLCEKGLIICLVRRGTSASAHHGFPIRRTFFSDHKHLTLIESLVKFFLVTSGWLRLDRWRMFISDDRCLSYIRSLTNILPQITSIWLKLNCWTTFLSDNRHLIQIRSLPNVFLRHKYLI